MRALTALRILALVVPLGSVAIAAEIAVPAQVYPIDRAHSTLALTVGLGGMTEVQGGFRDYQGAIAYDPSDMTRSSVTFIIRTTSIDTASEERDNHLRSKDFFDVEKYPIARFESKRVEKTPEGYRALGELTLHGVTHPVVIPFRRKSAGVDVFQNERITFEGEFDLSRADFGIAGPTFWSNALSDKVHVRFVASARVFNYNNIFSSNKPDNPTVMLVGAAREGGVSSLREKFVELTTRAEGKTPMVMDAAVLAAARLMQAGKLDESLTLLELSQTHFAKDPEVATLQTWFGRVRAARGERDLAVACFMKILEANPNDPYAYEMIRFLNR